MANKNQITLKFIIILFFSSLIPYFGNACSTFKLQHANKIICGHNLNQGDIGVPGMIFINKRGVFKTGNTWDEIINKTSENVSGFSWISRYGSVTFNAFGRDLPDGGMNEVGLYIWEMSEDADYPKNEELPKLNQMTWMQYILDNCSNLEEAILCASEIEIDGWGWHFFIGDSNGNTAAVAFVDGKVIVHKNLDMTVPALFNTPYERELEFLKYYKGFGGLYEPDLNDSKVPRFVKSAVMLRDYDASENIVDYGFKMLQTLKVDDEPEWSVIFNISDMSVYFKTRLNPEIKHFSLDEIDFSNESPVLILNIDIAEGGDINQKLHPYSGDKFKTFTESYVIPILPEEFFTSGGLTVDEYVERVSSISDQASASENQYFIGTWKNDSQNDENDMEIYLILNTEADAVSGKISLSGDTEEVYRLDHIQLIDHQLKLTFKTKSRTLIEIQGIIEDDEMRVNVYGIEDHYGEYVLRRIL